MGLHSIRLTVSFNSSGDGGARVAARNAVRGVLGEHQIDKLAKTSSYSGRGLTLSAIRAALDQALAEVEAREAEGVSIDSLWLLIED